MADRRLGWNPWRALREREHLVFAVDDLPDVVGGGIYWPRGRRAAIILDRSLTVVERNAALAHELVHDEFGGGCDVEGMPAAWDAVAGRAEARVEDEVARRLVPLEDLAAMVAVAEANDLPGGTVEVADRYDVPEHVAARALRLLRSA